MGVRKLLESFVLIYWISHCDAGYGGGNDFGGQLAQSDVQAPAYAPPYLRNQQFSKSGYSRSYSSGNGGTKTGYGGTKTGYSGTKTGYSGTKTGYGGTKTGYSGTKSGYGGPGGYSERRTWYSESGSMERNLRGVRLMWNKGEPLPLKTAWNPFSQDVPFLTFASHPIYWHKEGPVEDRATFDMEVFAQKLQRAIETMPSSSCCIHHSPIVIQSYVGVTSLLHNKTGLGFFKVRGKFSF